MKNNGLSKLLFSLATATGIAFGMASAAIAQPVDGALGESADKVAVDRAAQERRAARAAAQAAYERNSAHSTLPFTFDGQYVVSKKAADNYYNGVDPTKFGSTTVMLPNPQTGQPMAAAVVRDMHYPLARDAQGKPTKVGMRLIPISEPHMELAAGEEPDPKKPGSNLIDRLIRKTQGLGPNDPIFATIVYLHPENHSGDIKQLASEALKTEGGQTHLGMYLGKGFTRNSPEDYHQQGWSVGGYPATVQLISMKGTDQATLNRNGHIASGILNNGVQFPGDYKNDVYQTVSLGRTLEFYRGWLTDDPKLTNENSWATYCAEHVTIVTNIMLNVPHNKAAFAEIWGAEEGARLLDLAKAKYRAATGEAMVETSFEPLWKKDGITNPAKLGIGDEIKQSEIGPGLAWAPQHNADLLANFLEVYASWPEVGAPMSAAAMLGFKEQLVGRMLNTDQSEAAVAAEQKKLSDSFDQLAIPVITKMFIFEAMTKKPSELKAYATQSTATLYVALGGQPQDLIAGGTPNPQIMGLVKVIKQAVMANKDKIVAGSKNGTTKAEAYAAFKEAIKPEVDAARTVNVSNPDKVVRYNSPPAVTHRVASGLHQGNANVTVEEVATVFEAEELITKAERDAAAAAAANGTPPTGDDPGAAGRLNGVTDGNTEGNEPDDGPRADPDDDLGDLPEGWTDMETPESTIGHFVIWGDTLWGISQMYGVTVRQIQEANGMAPSNTTIHQDTWILIPVRHWDLEGND